MALLRHQFAYYAGLYKACGAITSAARLLNASGEKESKNCWYLFLSQISILLTAETSTISLSRLRMFHQVFRDQNPAGTVQVQCNGAVQELSPEFPHFGVKIIQFADIVENGLPAAHRVHGQAFFKPPVDNKRVFLPLRHLFFYAQPGEETCLWGPKWPQIRLRNQSFTMSYKKLDHYLHKITQFPTFD